MDLHGSFHVYDTTLRDGAQQEGLNLSVADKLTIARQLDGLGVGYIEGGWPGREPQGHRVLPPGRRPSSTCGTPSSRRSAPPAGRVSWPPTTHRSPRCGTAAPRSSRWSRSPTTGTSSSRCAPRWRRTSRWCATPSSHLKAEGQQVFLDAEHFFDGYRANRDYALEVLRTAYEAGADVIALCDTNGGMLPGLGLRRRPRRGRDDRGPGRHPRPQRQRLRGRELAGRGRRGRDPRAGLHQRLRRAHRQRRPRLRRGQPRAQARPCGPAARAAPGLDPDRARRRRGDQLPAGLAAAVRRRVGVRAQGRAARQRDQGRPGPVPAHAARAGRQRHAAARLRHGRPGLDRAQGPRARLRPVGPTASWSPR